MFPTRGPQPPRADTAPARAPVAPDAQPRYTPLPARPFAVAASVAGHAFVSMPRPDGRGLAVLAAEDPWRIAHVHWLAEDLVPRGLVLDRGGRYLVVANGAGGLFVVDVARLTAGDEDPLAAVATSPGRGSMQLRLDATDRFAFVTDEDSATLSVFDFGASLASDAPAARLVGQVALDPAPVGIALSPDGERLLITCQGGRGGGTLAVIPVAQVIAAPERARVRSLAAGTAPVRVVVSAQFAWVTARGSNSVLAFDLETLRLRAAVQVGPTPVGLALVGGESIAVVANSNRYGEDPEASSSLSVVDTRAALEGRDALLAELPAGAFPRELTVLEDDRTVLVTNVRSQTLETIAVVTSGPALSAT